MARMMQSSRRDRTCGSGAMNTSVITVTATTMFWDVHQSIPMPIGGTE